MRRLFCLSILLLAPGIVFGVATYQVTSIGDANITGTLRNAILTSSAGDTIDCKAIAGQSIQLSESLPPINYSVTITTSIGAAVTIDGRSAGVPTYQAFSLVSGTVTLQNLQIDNCISLGGAGGLGSGGGGGGAGGGGGVYVENGVNLTLSSIGFTGNVAQGGAGGVVSLTSDPGGGGGGGYGGGNGGAGKTGGNVSGGGGGGGNPGGGVGGDSAAIGGPGALLGGGGGGGGSNSATVGGAGGPSATAAGGTGTIPFGGGGGGGGSVAGSNATALPGGNGGAGFGVGGNFGGGGGGGGGTDTSNNGGSGGTGSGTGGGGGGGGNVGIPVGVGGPGGAGGLAGGGGGGGGAQSAAGMGGFGAGGGGSEVALQQGTSLFGGGSGGGGVGGNGGGGGGAGMGGALFIQNGATVTISDPFAPGVNIVTAGASGGTGASAGGTFGPDIFLRSGASLIFNNSNQNITIGTNIASDQGVGGGTGGGLTMSGSKILTLSSVTNTYSGGTTINAGTINVSADASLGQLGQTITIGAGTLQAGATFSSPRPITLSGAASIDSQGNTLTLSGIISGAGSLTKVGTGTLILSGVNSYGGGTTITAGTISAAADSAFGAAAGAVSIGNATLRWTNSLTSARSFTLTSTATIDPQANTVTMSGNIGGAGSLTKASGGTLILTGTNSYNGAVVSAGTLQGNTSSLKGNIQNNGTLIFNQTFQGTYSGALSGNGPLTVQGGGLLAMTGNSSAFTGTTLVTSGTLQVDGSMASSTMDIAAAGTLSGSGTVGSVNSFGVVAPGTPLTVQGSFLLQANASVLITLMPTSSTKINASGAATLTNANLNVQHTSGFFGLNRIYTILTASTLGGTQFSTVSSFDSNFQITTSYTLTSVLLGLKVLNPFFGVAFLNSNAQNVAYNITALNLGNFLPQDTTLVGLGSSDSSVPTLTMAIDALAGQNNVVISDALDQMHPAPYSAFAEVQSEVGSQIVSLFDRPFSCGCNGAKRFWVEPFGNWLSVDNEGQEVGFEAIAKGVAGGVDLAFSDWVLGFGGAWNTRELVWKKNRGHGTVEGLYGAIYSNYMPGNFSFTAAVVGGYDRFDVTRQIQYTTINEHPQANYGGLDLVGRLKALYLFGDPAFAVYPYASVDYLYLDQSSFQETNAGGLDLVVQQNISQTLRPEAGIGFQFQDVNQNETMCIAPKVSLGWAMAYPLARPLYHTNFVGMPIPYEVVGWNRTWQMFNVKFGLTLTYRCFSVVGDYDVEMSVDDSTALLDQRCNVGIEFKW
jgi:autotransporter-associated beta strand protein